MTPLPLADHFARLLAAGPPPETRGRKPLGSEAMTARERDAKYKRKKKAARLENIAVLDFETDPFDSKKKAAVFPFLAVLYSEKFDPIIIWEDHYETLITRLIEAIKGLPDKFTIYAHNGGKFDFMFLMRGLRGHVKFKGRSLMCGKIGAHELRDSFHIIPEKLANWKKDNFDYSQLEKSNRSNNREAIIRYCVNDCKYLFDIVKMFLADFGFKISIGQAAMAELRKSYDVERVGQNMDAFLRGFFYGGRVECLQGRGHWGPGYKLYDVNSMYPFAMAHFRHPIGSEFIVRSGKPNADTVFLELSCRNHGALIRRNENNETSATEECGVFKTTIWEYQTALRLGLISDVIIRSVVDCRNRSDFSEFVYPLYNKRQGVKQALKDFTGSKESPEYNELKKDDIFLKLLMNNAYGKFAQNPRRFKESYVTDPQEDANDVDPDIAKVKGLIAACDDPDKLAKLQDRLRSLYWGLLPTYETGAYWIWERPSPSFRFNNVATAASITGAARAVLMEAIENANDPIYCDTDSIICRDLRGVPIHSSDLGAWDLESEFDEVLIAGKKLYGCKISGLPDGHKDRIKIRSKGVSGLTWNDVVDVVRGEVRELIAKAPTITRTGNQFYMTRKIRATAPAIQRRKPQPSLQRIA